MPNPWIEHVKNYAKDHNLSYKDALKEAKSSYKTDIAGGARDPSAVVRAIYGKNRKKFNIDRVQNPSKHLLTTFENIEIPKKEKKSRRKKGNIKTPKETKNVETLKEVIETLKEVIETPTGV